MKTKFLFVLFITLAVVLLFSSPGTAHFDRKAVEKTSVFLSAPLSGSRRVFTVNITDLGFDPSELTIEEGDTVEWVNQTQAAVVLEEGEIYQIYLPLVMKTSGTRSTNELLPQVVSSTTGQTINPGESYTSTLTTQGTYHYYRGGDLFDKLKITVNPKPPDLEILTINFDVNPAPPGNTVHLSVQIHNLGLGAANNFSVEWGLFQVGQIAAITNGDWDVASLLANESKILTTTFTVPVQPGPYILQVLGDPGSALLDTDLSNNDKEVDFGVAGIINFCGNITADTTWAYATYVLTCNVDIVSGATLTVTNGAVLKPQGTMIQVHGDLELAGNDQVPVVVTSYYDDAYGGDTNLDGTQTLPTPGQWSGISIFPSGYASLLHAILRYATVSLQNNEGTLIMTDSTVEYGSQNGLNSYTSSNTQVESSTFQNNTGHGLYYSIVGTFAPVIKNTTFQTNTQYAVYFNFPGETILDGTQLSGNTAMNNGTNGLRLVGTFTGTSTLSGDLGFPYVLEEHASNLGSIKILSGSSLLIEPGAIFKGWGSSYWYGKGTGFEVGGTLTAVGTLDHPIIFTSAHDDAYGGDTNNNGGATLPADYHWTRMVVTSGGTATFDQVEILYAGGDVHGQSQESIRNDGGTLNLLNSTVKKGAGVGIRSYSNGVINIQNSLVQENTQHGLYYSAQGAAVPVIQNTTFLTNTQYAVYFVPSGDLSLDGTQMSGNTAVNNGINGLRLAGTFTGTSTLSGDLGFPYVLEEHASRIGSIYITPGSTMLIEPGAVFKGWGSSYSYGKGTGFEVGGTLTAVGTSNQPIVFTSAHDDAYGGDTNNNGGATLPAHYHWTRMVVTSGGTATFDQVEILYAGGDVYGQSQESIRNDGGTLNLLNSTVKKGAGVGIRSYSNGVINIQNSLIQENTQHGLYYSAQGAATPVIQNTTFLTNTQYAIYFVPSGDFSLDGTQMSGNTAMNNGANGLRLAGTFTGTSTLSGDLGFPYVLEEHASRIGSIYITPGSTFVIEPGAVFKGWSSSLWYGKGTGFEVGGTLTAVGTSNQPIVFTSAHDDAYSGDTNNNGGATLPANYHWTRIVVTSGGTATFDHVKILYSGGEVSGQSSESIRNVGGTLNLLNSTVEKGISNGIRSYANGVINIHDSVIQENTGHGLSYSAQGAATPVIQNTTFLTNTQYAVYFEPSGALSLDGTQMSGNTAMNNGINGLRLVGIFTGASTLSGNLGFPYVLEEHASNIGSIQILSGSSLLIEPGAVIKGGTSSYWYGKGTGIEVLGVMTATGTLGQPIIFTSLHDDANGGDTNNNGGATVPANYYWTRLIVRSGGTATFDHVKILYAGGGVYGQSAESIRNEGNVSLNYALLMYSADMGVRNLNGTLTVQNSQLANFPTAIWLGTTTNSASITNTDFLNNTTGLYFAGNYIPVISNCIFEGNTSNGLNNVTGLTLQAPNNWWGDVSGPKPGGSGDAVSGLVNVTPWLTTRPR